MERPLELPLDHFAAVERSGDATLTPHAPDQLWFVPSEQVGSLIPADSSEDFRASLTDATRFPAGTVLYEVQTVDGDVVGWVRTTSALVASDWGDRRLFFQHPLRED